MIKDFCDKFELRLIFLTVFLLLSYGFLSNFTDLGLLFLPAFFSIIGVFVLIAQLLRTFVPKIRKSIVYKILMLFDLLDFAQFVRTKMREIHGKGKKKRHIAMAGGLLLYVLGLSLIVIQTFFGLTLMNIDNGVTGYSPPIYQQVTVSSLVILGIAVYVFAMSIILMGYGFHKKFEESGLVTSFVDSLSSSPLFKKDKSPSIWSYYNKKQKCQYTATLIIWFILLMVEFYYLGFIVSPAQTFGTTAEETMTTNVLNVFGNWTNVILAEIGLLTIILLTMLIPIYITKRLDASIEKDLSLKGLSKQLGDGKN